MIYFVGCSYTWGAGLEYEYYHKYEGWNHKKINNNIPPKVWLESSNYKASEYRRKHRFANLVSQQLNVSYEVINQVNGGDHENIRWLLNNQPLTNGCDAVVVQLTQWQRSSHEFRNNTIRDEEHIEQIIEQQIKSCFHTAQNKGVKVFAISWQRDTAEILKNKFPDKFIPLYIDGKYYDSFTHTQSNEEFNSSQFKNPYNMRLSDVIPGVQDTHLSSEGHKIVADSIVHKLKDFVGKRTGLIPR